MSTPQPDGTGVDQGASAPQADGLVRLPAPTLRRRAACLVYEVMLLFGVGLVPALFTTLAVGGMALGGWRAALGQLIFFLCFGLYFVWSWTRRGQTLPMQTWRIRLITQDGRTPGLRQACLRYLAAWLWVAPAIVLSQAAGWSRWWVLGTVFAWACAYGALALRLAGRQFAHDVLCGTRLVQLPAAATRTAG